jgi:uncharacterized protein YecT (DUF1311 family)
MLCATRLGAEPAPSAAGRAHRDVQVCMDQHASTLVIAQCINAVVRREDRRLQEVLRATLAEERDAKRRQAIAGTQRVWAEYRRKQCDLVDSAPDGGTLRWVNSALCLFVKVEARIAELDDPRGERLWP